MSEHVNVVKPHLHLHGMLERTFHNYARMMFISVIGSIFHKPVKCCDYKFTNLFRNKKIGLSLQQTTIHTFARRGIRAGEIILSRCRVSLLFPRLH